MPGWLVAIVVAVAVYAAAILALIVAGRGVEAREFAALVPRLALLFWDLVRDPRVRRGPKVWLVVGGLWLASPIDLVPEFIPVIGPLDDALVAALVLRHLVRRAGPAIVHEHWRGDPTTLDRILRAARVSDPEAVPPAPRTSSGAAPPPPRPGSDRAPGAAP